MNNIEGDPFQDKYKEEFWGLTSLEEYVFLPSGLYMCTAEKIHTIFDSGCSVAVTSVKEDFQGILISVNKKMMVLGALTQVKGGGLVS